jgi:hypothetical protein
MNCASSIQIATADNGLVGWAKTGLDDCRQQRSKPRHIYIQAVGANLNCPSAIWKIIQNSEYGRCVIFQ